MSEIERRDERDPQDTAEGLDEEVVFDDTDTSGDEYGNGLPSYPPDRWLGDENEPESGEARDRGSSETVPDDDAVGQLVEPNVSSPDDEEELLGEAVPGRPLGAEEAAVHVERER